MNFYNDDFSILNSMDFPKDLKNVKNLQFNFIGGKNSERQNHNFNSR